jgi:tetratricopeptide (TPR) repeat protein
MKSFKIRKLVFIQILCLVIAAEHNFIIAQSKIKNYNDSLLTVCQKYFYNGSYEKVVTSYSKKEMNKLSPEELFLIGQSYSNQHNYLKALLYFQKAAEINPESKTYLLQVAGTQSNLGKNRDAIASFIKVLDFDPNDRTGLFELANIYLLQKNYAGAENLFYRLVSLDPEDYIANYYMALALITESETDNEAQAQEYLKASIAASMEFIPSMDLYAQICFKKKKFYDANSFYNIIKKLNPENPDYHYRSGLCYEKIEQFGLAANCFRKSIQLSPQTVLYWDHFGYAMFNQAKYDSAIILYLKVLELEPGNSSYYANLGYCYAKTDSVEKAITCFNKAISLLPQKRFAELFNQIGAINYTQNNYQDAKAAYEKALLYQTDNLDSRMALGIISDKLKEWNNARQYYNQIIEITANDSTQTEKHDFAVKRLAEMKKTK